MMQATSVTAVFQVLVSTGVLATLGGVIRVVWLAGRTYDRLEVLERKVERIDTRGCEHLRDCKGILRAEERSK